VITNIQDVIFVRPESFETKHTRDIALELDKLNLSLLEAERPYLLVVYGRLGTTDPWLGIPVVWSQVSGAKAIVEASKEDFDIVLSQGSHYFHNLTSLGVSYFSIPYSSKYQIDWDWLNTQEIITETDFLRHVRVPVPLRVKVDGRRGKGVIHKSIESDHAC
jgi:hypothetical protein